MDATPELEAMVTLTLCDNAFTRTSDARTQKNLAVVIAVWQPRAEAEGN
jgi:hypothetical protein